MKDLTEAREALEEAQNQVCRAAQELSDELPATCDGPHDDAVSALRRELRAWREASQAFLAAVRA